MFYLIQKTSFDTCRLYNFCDVYTVLVYKNVIYSGNLKKLFYARTFSLKTKLKIVYALALI